MPPDSPLESCPVLCGDFSVGKAGAEETERGIPTAPAVPVASKHTAANLQTWVNWLAEETEALFVLAMKCL